MEITADSPIHLDPATTIAEQFEARVAEHPHAPALSLDGATLTYGELNTRANQLARNLRELGVGPESLVAIHLDRSFDLLVAIFGILKAGGAYLPLDMACPADRLDFQLSDAGAKVALTHTTLAPRLKNFSGTILCLDEAAADLATRPANNLPPCSSAENLAYVIYTSGSTGTPKGCLVTQQNVLRLFAVTEPQFGFGRHDAWTLFHSSAFDFSVWEIFGALLYGGRLVIVPHIISRSAADFRELLDREKVTVLNQTPSAFRQLVQADLAIPAPLSAPPRYVVFGGEALDFETLRPWFARYGDKRPQLINMYGITETTVHVTYRAVTMADLDSRCSNIGHPLADLRVYLVDQDLKLTPSGQAGEMLVGGPGVARGYLNRPELTAQRFIPDPFGGNGLLYRSGDLARERGNGELQYLGRIDHQVKIRGFRVELAEIESVFAQHPGIAECAVLARQDHHTDPRLVAYIVASPGESPTVESLRQHAAFALPDYMVPGSYVFLPAFPLTVNGKLDRAALPAPGAERPQLAAKYEEPAAGLEAVLARLWKTALHHAQVGAEDNFFDLGGTSLLATAVHMQLQAELRREIPITDLFQFPTIRKLAAHLSGDSSDAPGMAAQVASRAQKQRDALLRARQAASRTPGIPGGS